MWIIVFLFSSTLTVSGDAPVEQFYFNPSDIPQTILREARGAVTIMCLDAAFMKKYLNKIVPEVMVTLYVRTDDTFKKDETVNISGTKPLSGWLFNGTKVRRFPAVDRNGDFLKIVYDLERDLRAWINIQELSSLMPKGWGESASVMWFDTGKFGEYDGIDIFELLPNKRRKLYDEPYENSPGLRIDPLSDIRGESGNLTAIEQRNGFIRLGVYDPCEGKRRKLKWIRVRDKKGRLTVWPIVGLSC